MRLFSVLLAIMLAASFSGCISELLGDTPQGASQITKKAILTVTERSFGESTRLEDLVKTSLEYVHRGADVAASALTADYTGPSGSARSQSFTLFTTKTMLHEGDIVTIPEANFTSGLVVRDGSKVLAERSGETTSWFRVDGVPFPLSSTAPGDVRYHVSSSGGFDVAATDFDQDEVHVSNAAAKLDMGVSGSLDIKTLAASAGPRLEASSNIVPTASIDASASVRDSHGSYETGVKTTDMKGQFEGLGVLQFSNAGDLTRTGGSGKGTFDGKIHVWDRDHPKDSNYEPSDVKHPMLDETQAYSENAFEPSSEAPPAWIIDFFTKLWSMPVAVGDDYRVHSEYRGGGGGFQFDIVLQIVAQENRPIGGAIYPSYRVSQVANLVAQPPGGAEASFDLVHGTYWVATASHLPVYGQTSYARSFDRADIERLLKAVGSDAPVSIPATVTLALRGEQTIQLESYSGNLKVPPIVGVLLSNPGSIGGWSPGAMFGMMGNLGGHETPAMATPVVSFSNDEAKDRISVVDAPLYIPWTDYELKATGDTGTLKVRLNGEAGAQGTPVNDYYTPLPSSAFPGTLESGDYLDFCSSMPASNVQVSLMYAPSNSVVHTYTFVGLPTDPMCL